MFHYLKNNECYFQSKVRKAGIPTLDNYIVEQFEVPVPPLEMQREIVRIIDNFNSICMDISSGLPVEIEARTKQYEYYRDKLFFFKRNEAC